MDKNTQLLSDLVERVGNRIRADVRNLENAHNLQPVHLQALKYIKQANRYSNTPQGLTEYLGQTKGSISQSLILLHRKGLIDRYMDETDKRQVRLSLNEAGEKLLKEILLTSNWQTATKHISPNKLKTAVLVLNETLNNLHIIENVKSFGVCNTCLYCRQESKRIFRCGLTADKLGITETRKICRLHISPA